MSDTKNIDPRALYALGYGLYVLTTNDGKRDNGCIVNSVMQTAINPDMVAISVSKQNYTHDTLRAQGKCNVCVLTEDAPFSVFEHFGFQSGRDTDKFADCSPNRSANGLVVLPKYTNAYLSLAVEQYIDLGSHGMFLCRITESASLSTAPTMTYAYYHANVKPNPAAKPAEKKTKTFACTICGYTYEGDSLPADFICPWCKHPASDFEEVE